jgi:AcrR family transcriptional regulator
MEMPRKANIRPDEPGRERVLAAALELFGERGYDATSIADIGDRAGIAKSLLYHYFGSKAKLYEAVLEAETRDALKRVAAAVPSDREAARVRAGVEAYLDFLAESPATWRLFLRDHPAEPALIGVYERLANERAAGLTALLTTASKRRGAPWHVELVATGIRAFAAWWYDHREVPREAVADAILEFAIAGAQRIDDKRQPAPTRRRPR